MIIIQNITEIKQAVEELSTILTDKKYIIVSVESHEFSPLQNQKKSGWVEQLLIKNKVQYKIVMHYDKGEKNTSFIIFGDYSKKFFLELCALMNSQSNLILGLRSGSFLMTPPNKQGKDAHPMVFYKGIEITAAIPGSKRKEYFEIMIGRVNLQFEFF